MYLADTWNDVFEREISTNEIRPILKYFVPAVCIFVTTVPKIVWVAYNFENIPFVLALDDVKSNLPQ